MGRKKSEAASPPAGGVVEAEARRLSTLLRKLHIDARPTASGLGVEISLVTARMVVQLVGDARRMWRVSRRQPYLGCIGENDPAARDCYHVNAPTALAAAMFAREMFPYDKAGFTVQSFEHVGEGAHGAVVGEFFGENDEQK